MKSRFCLYKLEHNILYALLLYTTDSIMIVFCLFIVAILFALGAYERTTKGYKAAIKLSCPGVLLPIIGNSYVVLRYTASKSEIYVLLF